MLHHLSVLLFLRPWCVLCFSGCFATLTRPFFRQQPNVLDATSAAVETRLAAKMSSHFEDLTRLVLQSRAEVRRQEQIPSARADDCTQADSKLQAQCAALRRALTEELRECVHSALAPRLDRALEEAFEQMETAVCSGVDSMTAETARAAGLIDALVERNQQARSSCRGRFQDARANALSSSGSGWFIVRAQSSRTVACVGTPAGDASCIAL